MSCFECGKVGHMKRDCPKLNHDKNKVKNQQERRPKRKAFQVTWDYSDSSSSDDESYNEQANVCFMATYDEVRQNYANDDLLEINICLLEEKKKQEILRKETYAKLSKAELEIDMLRDEKVILENDLVKSQETVENLNSHIPTLENELKI